MSYKLFLDDERFPVGDDWVVCRTVEDAQKHVKAYGVPSYVSFDNDLGTAQEGYDFAKWLCYVDMYEIHSFPVDFSWYAHTQNCVARDRINNYLQKYFDLKGT